jgi:hypothetical protein
MVGQILETDALRVRARFLVIVSPAYLPLFNPTLVEGTVLQSIIVQAVAEAADAVRLASFVSTAFCYPRER